MGSTRTQIYLTDEQRRRLDARSRREGRSLAALIRDAIDRYLGDQDPSDVQAALDGAFGALPHLTVPSRSEWEDRFERVYAREPTDR
jgi:hypothetical protein